MALPFDNVNPVRKTYFINESERDSVTPANDAGKVPQLESGGYLSTAMIKKWELITTTTLASDATSVSFTNLSGYTEVLLIARPNAIRNDATGNSLFAEVSVDNGANWLTTGAYVSNLSSEGNNISLGSYADGLLNIMLQFMFFNSSLPLKPVHVGQASNFAYSVVTSTPLNAFRIYFPTAVGNHRFETGSVFYLYGHK